MASGTVADSSAGAAGDGGGGGDKLQMGHCGGASATLPLAVTYVTANSALYSTPLLHSLNHTMSCTAAPGQPGVATARGQ